MPRTVALSQNGVWVGMRLWPKVATPTCGRPCSGETKPVAAITSSTSNTSCRPSAALHALEVEHRRFPRPGDTDRKNEAGRAVLAVRGGEDEVVAGRAGRLPPALVADLQTRAGGKRLQAPLHLRSGWEVGGAVHDAGHDRPAGIVVAEQAVPVVALVGRAPTLVVGVRLGPAEHPLEDRPAPEHPAGLAVLRDDRVLNAQPAERVRQLKSARPAADDQQRIASRRKRPVCHTGPNQIDDLAGRISSTTWSSCAPYGPLPAEVGT